jgi:hypothetical protein
MENLVPLSRVADVLGVSTGDAIAASESRARAFRTRQVADPADFVRTYGALVLTDGCRLSSDDWVAAVERARMDVPADCARGKLAIVGRAGDDWSIQAHQLADGGTGGDVVACSNATAAAAGLIAETVGGTETHLVLELPDGHQTIVAATVAPNLAAGYRVDQRWTDIRCAFEPETLVDGRRCIRVVGALNHYLVVRVRDADDLAAVSIDDAVRLSHHFGHDSEPLRSRIAFVHAGSDRRSARFFTCDQRQHPSAPLTGLAVLALASGTVEWLTPAATLEVTVGAMPPPVVRWTDHEIAEIDFPPILVDLETAR